PNVPWLPGDAPRLRRARSPHEATVQPARPPQRVPFAQARYLPRGYAAAPRHLCLPSLLSLSPREPRHRPCLRRLVRRSTPPRPARPQRHAPALQPAQAGGPALRPAARRFARAARRASGLSVRYINASLADDRFVRLRRRLRRRGRLLRLGRIGQAFQITD